MMFDVDGPENPPEPEPGFVDALKATASAATPIIRGQCNGCGISRNLCVSELGDMEGMCIPCHCRPHGCEGVMVVVYSGPKVAVDAKVILTPPCICHS